MSKSIKLTDRALIDFAEIDNNSIKKWGGTVADKYLDDIEVGLNLLQENSGLLQELEDFSGKLKYYRVKNHFLICTETGEFVIVLTIKHVQMDIINQILKFEPSLMIEVELLFDRLAQA